MNAQTFDDTGILEGQVDSFLVDWTDSESLEVKEAWFDTWSEASKLARKISKPKKGDPWGSQTVFVMPVINGTKVAEFRFELGKIAEFREA